MTGSSASPIDSTILESSSTSSVAVGGGANGGRVGGEGCTVGGWSDADVVRAYRAGANVYMVKPVRATRLAHTVQLLTGQLLTGGALAGARAP